MSSGLKYHKVFVNDENSTFIKKIFEFLMVIKFILNYGIGDSQSAQILCSLLAGIHVNW